MIKKIFQVHTQIIHELEKKNWSNKNVEIINNKLCPGFNTSTFMKINVKKVTDLILC